jgi:hypothetical protein
VKGLLAFLITSYDISAKKKLALQLLLSVFDVIYNTIAMPRTVFELPVHLALSVKMKIHLLLLIFNSIVAPLCVTSLIDKNCFANVFQEPNEITTYVSYMYCDETISSDNTCTHYSTLALQTSFEPPFTYSYQCTSALLSTFTPSFIFTYTFLGVVVPAILLALLAFCVIADPVTTEKWHKFLPSYFRYKDPKNRWHRVIKRLLPNLLHHLAVLLTFGTTSPILALAIGAAVISTSTVWILIIGWYLTMCLERKADKMSSADAIEKLYLLEKACFEVLTGPKKATFIVVDGACLFFAVLAMDIGGDEVGALRAVLCLVTPTLCVPVLLRVAIHCYASLQNTTSSERNVAASDTEGKKLCADENAGDGQEVCLVDADTLNSSRNRSRSGSTSTWPFERVMSRAASRTSSGDGIMVRAVGGDGVLEMRSMSTAATSAIVESPLFASENLA